MSLLQEKVIDGETHYLYSCCYERKTGPTTWLGDILYTHAKDAPHARFLFTQNLTTLGCVFRIVAVAPAIGFQVLDDHGEKLIA